MGWAPLRQVVLGACEELWGQPKPWWLLPLSLHPGSRATPWEGLEHPAAGPPPGMWKVLMRKGVLAGQLASCLTAGRFVLEEREVADGMRNPLFPLAAASCRLLTI